MSGKWDELKLWMPQQTNHRPLRPSVPEVFANALHSPACDLVLFKQISENAAPTRN